MAGGVSANGTGAPPQAGVLDGINPIVYNPSNPITLFIVQASGPFPVAYPATPISVQVRAPTAVLVFRGPPMGQAAWSWPGRAGFRIPGVSANNSSHQCRPSSSFFFANCCIVSFGFCQLGVCCWQQC